MARGVLVALALCWAGACRGAEWRECKPAGAGFVVSLPGTAVHAQVDASTPLGNVRLYTWEANLGDIAFTALYGDYPAEVVRRNKPINMLIHASDSIVGVTEGSLTINRWLRVGGYPARDIEVVSVKTKATIRCRLVLAGTRLYQVMAARPRATEGAAEVRRFIESFRLLEPASAHAKPGQGRARKRR